MTYIVLKVETNDSELRSISFVSLFIFNEKENAKTYLEIER